MFQPPPFIGVNHGPVRASSILIWGLYALIVASSLHAVADRSFTVNCHTAISDIVGTVSLACLFNPFFVTDAGPVVKLQDFAYGASILIVAVVLTMIAKNPTRIAKAVVVVFVGALLLFIDDLIWLGSNAWTGSAARHAARGSASVFLFHIQTASIIAMASNLLVGTLVQLVSVCRRSNTTHVKRD